MRFLLLASCLAASYVMTVRSSSALGAPPLVEHTSACRAEIDAKRSTVVATVTIMNEGAGQIEVPRAIPQVTVWRRDDKRMLGMMVSRAPVGTIVLVKDEGHVVRTRLTLNKPLDPGDYEVVIEFGWVDGKYDPQPAMFTVLAK